MIKSRLQKRKNRLFFRYKLLFTSSNFYSCRNFKERVQTLGHSPRYGLWQFYGFFLGHKKTFAKVNK